MLRQARRKVADFVLGDDIVLFAPKRYLDMLGLDDYSEMPDGVLAETTRRFFSVIGQVYEKDAKQRGLPFSVFLTQCATLALARMAHDVNAETATYHISGSVDGGETLEDFHIEVKRKPHDDADWDDAAPAVERVEEGGKITSLTYRIRTHDQFEKWRADRAASVDTHAERGDSTEIEAPSLMGSAVGAAETPQPHPKGQTRSNKSRPVT